MTVTDPTRHVTLLCPPGQQWAFQRMPNCPDCGGQLVWWDCERAFGCVKCPDCDAEFFVKV